MGAPGEGHRSSDLWSLGAHGRMVTPADVGSRGAPGYHAPLRLLTVGEKLGDVVTWAGRESVEDKENENPKNFNEMPVE